MTILRRDGLGLPKLQEFINAAVDFAVAVHEQNAVASEILSDPAADDINDRVPLGPSVTKSLTIKEESDDDLQQSCSRIISSPNTSRSTRDALKKIDINFHPAQKHSVEVTPKGVREVHVVPLKGGKKTKNPPKTSVEQQSETTNRSTKMSRASQGRSRKPDRPNREQRKSQSFLSMTNARGSVATLTT